MWQTLRQPGRGWALALAAALCPMLRQAAQGWRLVVFAEFAVRPRSELVSALVQAEAAKPDLDWAAQ